MKRVMGLVLVFLLLTGCGDVPQPVMETPSELLGQSIPEEIAEEFPPPVYIPPKNLTVEETVAAYFEQQYLSYIYMTPINFTAILDTTVPSVRNIMVWGQMLAQRRKLLRQENLCFLQTDPLPYTINYIPEEELADDRIKNWEVSFPEDKDSAVVHFVITGISGEAYPPVIAVNSQHTIRMKRLDGVWKISFHYFPGSIHKFRRSGELVVPTEEEMLADLRKEFAATDPGTSALGSSGDATYNGEAAAAYARWFTESPNPGFYTIDDWMGNCANFTSQCIWYGFGEGEWQPDGNLNRPMTNSWYAGGGGGSPAWENVEGFWSLITEGVEIQGRQLEGISEVEPGDLIQTSTGIGQWDNFNHSLIVVDSDSLLLAQNSPNCFVYYSDLVNIGTRIIRPVNIP